MNSQPFLKIFATNIPQVLIYYFVSEVYVWSGVGANRSLLEKALKIARTMVSQFYNSFWNVKIVRYKPYYTNWEILTFELNHLRYFSFFYSLR